PSGGEHSPLRFLKERDHLRARNAGKPVEEIFNGVAGFKMLNQRLDRNARASETRRAAHDLGIDFDDRRHLYLGCFPQRSTATLAALPAMSLIPVAPFIRSFDLTSFGRMFSVTNR